MNDETRNNRIATMISVGLVISVIHQPNQPLLKYLFLPVIGNLLVIMGCVMFLMKQKTIDLGSKWLWIPLAVISGSIVLRPIYATVTNQTQWGMNQEWAGAGYGIALFGLYLTARKLGAKIFNIFTPAIIIASISIVIFGFINRGIKTGGLVSITNYDIATGFLIFGLVVSALQKRWWLSAIVLVGLFFTGADEAIFVTGVLLVVIIAREVIDIKTHPFAVHVSIPDTMWLPIAAILFTLLVTIPLNIPQELYKPTLLKLEQVKNAIALPDGVTQKTEVVTGVVTGQGITYETKDLTRGELLNEATGYRWLTYWKLSAIKPLGYGYNINNFYRGIPHNVVLIIIEQIGILAALAWLWVAGYGLLKTKWKYAWVAVLTLSVFDHFMWTQAAFWVWGLAGVSSNSEIIKDWIYK